MRTPKTGVRMVLAKRAIRKPLRRRATIATASLCNACKTLHNDAVAIAVNRRNGSQIARVAYSMRTPIFGVRMERPRRAIREPLRRRT
eukprot:5412670-Lingulodinium_polyedra.AAC.1